MYKLDASFISAFVSGFAAGFIAFYLLTVISSYLRADLDRRWLAWWRDEKSRSQPKRNDWDRGFTLVEMAVVTMIAGVLLASVLKVVVPYMEMARLKATKANMERTIDVLASYAQRNNRIPCPAEPDQGMTAQPFGAERGSGPNGDQIGSCSGAETEGIVPFRTLGMHENEVQDGWKNFITYKVSPVFTLDPRDVTNQAHARCRTEGIWVQTGGNRNPQKARFCCPAISPFPQATDLRIEDGNGKTLWAFPRSAAGYDAVDVVEPFPVWFDAATDNVTVPAVMLVSHGKNGFGAFLSSGGRTTGTSGNDEQENADGDQVFIDRDRSTSGDANHFDDLLVWRTQDQLYSETGQGICTLP